MRRIEEAALAGAENIDRVRRTFEETIDKPVLNHGSGNASSAVSEQTREHEMALFRQASGSM